MYVIIKYNPQNLPAYSYNIHVHVVSVLCHYTTFSENFETQRTVVLTFTMSGHSTILYFCDNATTRDIQFCRISFDFPVFRLETIVWYYH